MSKTSLPHNAPALIFALQNLVLANNSTIAACDYAEVLNYLINPLSEALETLERLHIADRTAAKQRQRAADEF